MFFNSHNPADLTPVSRKWTILLYVDADNDLEIYGIRDINEAEYGMYAAIQEDPRFSERVSVVALLDRAGGTGTTYTADPTDPGGSDWTGARYYEIKADGTTDQWGAWEYGTFTSEMKQDLGEVNMGDAATIGNFIEWGKTNYPAEHYALILWNHGSGVKDVPVTTESTGTRAIAYDETSDDDALFTAEITDVLTEAHSVEVLGMDACLMGLAEIGYEYRPGVSGKFGADYFVGSPMNEPGDGWEYHHMLIRMSGQEGNDPQGHPYYNADTLTGAEFATLLVEEYGDRYASTGDAALTAVDNSKIADVKTALDALAAVIKDSKSTVDTVQTDTVHYFDIANSYEWLWNPHFDLYDFAEGLDSASSASTKAQALMTAVDNAVIASWAGSGFPNNEAGKNGLGFFFPDGDRDLTDFKVSYPAYYYTEFYTSADLYVAYGTTDYGYGKLDFLSYDDDDTVESWLELLEYWYDDAGQSLTVATY